MAIAMEIYEKIRYYREHTDYSQRNIAKILGVSRNTVKKYWEGQTVPWERKPGSGRKNDIITDEVKAFIIMCLESDKKAPRKQHHTAHKIYERLVAECGFEGCEASVRRTVAELRCNVKALRLYLDVGDELLKHLSYAVSYDTLYAGVIGNTTSKAPIETSVKIILPDLKRYDSLLKGGDAV